MITKETKQRGITISQYIVENGIDFDLLVCVDCGGYIDPCTSKDPTKPLKYKQYENINPIRCDGCFNIRHTTKSHYDSLLYRYGEDAMNIYKCKTSGSLESYIIRWGEDEGKKRYDVFSKKSSHTKRGYIKKYGKVDGKKKWSEYCNKKKETSKRSIEYWLKYHNGNIILAKQSQSDYQVSFSSLEGFIDRYGEVDGKKRYDEVSKSKGRVLQDYINLYGSDGEEKFAIRYGFESYKEMLDARGGKWTPLFYDKKYRLFIFQDQGFRCAICNTKTQDGLLFALHHIDYNKKNDARCNLIWLCCSCHMKTNYDRIMYTKKLSKVNEGFISKSIYNGKITEVINEYRES